MKKLSRMAAPLAVIALMIALALSKQGPAQAQSSAADAGINLRRTTTVEVVERTKDAVVYISSRKMVQRVIANSPFFTVRQNVPADSLGSGFVIHPDGYIVTNNHVIDGATQTMVTFLDGQIKPAHVISVDSDADLAILKVETDKPLPTIELGDSSDLMIGEPVIAVGNPLGLSHSVSTGIVSAIHRDLKMGQDGQLSGDFIQTDAAINFGNSGGPLLNAYGQVIGINSAIRGDAQNIGFAIPIDRLRDLIPELMNPGQANNLQMSLKFKEVRKLTPPSNVDSIVESTDGAKVVSIAGKKPRNIIDAYAILLGQEANKPFDVKFDGKPALRITPQPPPPPPDEVARAKSVLGLTVEQITPALAEKNNLPLDDGILIRAVDRGSPGERAGIRPGDVLIEIGRFRVSTLNNLGTLMDHMPQGALIKILVIRDGQQFVGSLVI